MICPLVFLFTYECTQTEILNDTSVLIVQDNIMSQLLWGDPQDEPGYCRSPRGLGWLFGPDFSKAFVERIGITGIMRGHQVAQKGTKVEHMR